MTDDLAEAPFLGRTSGIGSGAMGRFLPLGGVFTAPERPAPDRGERESFADFVCHDVITRCVSHSDGFGESSILLEISLRDPEAPLFRELFGKPTLECKMIMGQREATRWMCPRFEWL